MIQPDIDTIKSKIVPLLKQAGVTRSSLFGSLVRGDMSIDSDIDILIELPRGKTLFDLVRLESQLADILHNKVDLLTYKSISPRIKHIIDREQIQIL